MSSASEPRRFKYPPPFRKLRGYAFDPSLSLKIETVGINQLTYKIPWEDLQAKDVPSTGSAQPSSPQSEVGPVGEYVEVIDFDPTVNKFYAPVDLNDPYVAAQDGLAPSEGNPQFHQQMVNPVAMLIIKNFGASYRAQNSLGPASAYEKAYEEYVPRLGC